jgi:uncharacterized protein
VLYAEGRGVEKNPVAAGEYFLKAAMQGMADAALEYGVMVFRGDGVEKNEEIGAQWLLVSAQRGNVIAQNRVARVLAAGRGLKPDPVEAAKWHMLASKGGRTDSWLDEFVDRLNEADRAAATKRADNWTTLHAAETKAAAEKAASSGG